MSFSTLHVEDHDVVSCCPLLQKNAIGGWTRPSRDHFNFDGGKFVKVAWGLLKACFQAYIIHYHGPMGFVVREAKEVLSMQKPRDHDKEMPLSIILSFSCFCQTLRYLRC